jgi:hypothetical protein
LAEGYTWTDPLLVNFQTAWFGLLEFILDVGFLLLCAFARNNRIRLYCATACLTFFFWGFIIWVIPDSIVTASKILRSVGYVLFICGVGYGMLGLLCLHLNMSSGESL